MERIKFLACPICSFILDNSLDLIRAMTMHSPFAKGGQGGFECCGDSKIPLCPLASSPPFKKGEAG